MSDVFEYFYTCLCRVSRGGGVAMIPVVMGCWFYVFGSFRGDEHDFWWDVYLAGVYVKVLGHCLFDKEGSSVRMCPSGSSVV